MALPNKRIFINEEIRAEKIMLIDEDGKQLGTFSRMEAFRMGRESSNDLIQIGYNAKDRICTAKLMDYGKYMYNQKKEQSEKKKSQKSKGQKEVKLRYSIGENDLEFKLNKAKEFLNEGYNVRFAVVLRGRENIYRNKAYEMLKNVSEKLEDDSKSQGIKQEKNGYSMFLFAKLK